MRTIRTIRFNFKEETSTSKTRTYSRDCAALPGDATMDSTLATMTGHSMLIPRTRSIFCTAGRLSISPLILFTVILLALFLVDPGRCQTGPAASPILQLNVRALGYAPEPWPIENYGRIGIDPVCFLSNDAVAITFVTREAPGALSRRGQSDELLPYRLHAFFIDPKTGRVINTRDWPSSSLRSRVLPATGQKFVVLTPDRLLLYSSEFNLLGQLDVTWGRESIKDHWEVAHSPGGKYLLINYEPQADAKRIDQLPPTTPLSDWEPVERFERIDLENLQEVERWTTKICHDCFFTLGDHDAFGISDDGMVQRWKNVPGGTPFNSKIVEIGKPPDGPWR